ncbi:hypothetical protein SACE_1851 [Saccharopolyspora erythraea NRRL 2338]|uniref:Uncharacterized protein n=1 Tax=Saccharopolyspora erythraea (strain ATCC 11635 / DSM 40517 / JCM 4748 / NBRC 13426 / NCIMB 8594 / NRRL 2338) TaxID=405948 RepID=A4FAT8_SACEN|nr:hypothetical protein SACE_1851 [Saccharopolyspora erythraea NRRL 2338]
MLVGLVSLVLGLAALVLIAVLGHRLPTSYNPTTTVMVGMGGISAFFQVFSCVTLLTARSYVTDGHLDVPSATRARRLLVVFWSGTVATTVISCWVLVKAVESSGNFSRGERVEFGPPVVGYLVLLAVPCALALCNLLVGRWLLRPSARTLRGYADEGGVGAR